MFTCKQVSNALARRNYASMGFWQRLGLKLHVALCVVCGKYNRQVMVMQDAARKFREHEEELLERPGCCCLSAKDKEAMKKALHKSA